MTATLQSILSQVNSLDQTEKNTLLSCLVHDLEEFPSENNEAIWKEEITNRIEQTKLGKSKMINWESSINEAKERFNRTS